MTLINIWLTAETKISKRTVYNIFMMFSDVGGLNDFLGLLLATIFGFFSERLMLASLVSSLFHGSVSSVEKDDPSEALDSIKPFNNPKCFTLMQALTCGLCPRKQAQRRRAIALGSHGIDRELDVVRLIRQSRTLTTLVRLLLSRDERRLLKFQKREAVLKISELQNKEDDSSSFEDELDSTLLQIFKKNGDAEKLLAAPASSEVTSIDKLRSGVIYWKWRSDPDENNPKAVRASAAIETILPLDTPIPMNETRTME